MEPYKTWSKKWVHKLFKCPNCCDNPKCCPGHSKPYMTYRSRGIQVKPQHGQCYPVKANKLTNPNAMHGTGDDFGVGDDFGTGDLFGTD